MSRLSRPEIDVKPLLQGGARMRDEVMRDVLERRTLRRGRSWSRAPRADRGTGRPWWPTASPRRRARPAPARSPCADGRRRGRLHRDSGERRAPNRRRRRPRAPAPGAAPRNRRDTSTVRSSRRAKRSREEAVAPDARRAPGLRPPWPPSRAGQLSNRSSRRIHSDTVSTPSPARTLVKTNGRSPAHAPRVASP